MLTPMVSLARVPCSNCRDRHLKCDKRRPKCKRCETKGLDCIPGQRKAVFRRGSRADFDAHFADDQPWVNSEPRNWRHLAGYPRTSEEEVTTSQPSVSTEQQDQETLVSSGTATSLQRQTTASPPPGLPTPGGQNGQAEVNAICEATGHALKRRRLVRPISRAISVYSLLSSTTSNEVAHLPTAGEDRGPLGEFGNDSPGRGYGSGEPASDANNIIEGDENLSYSTRNEPFFQSFSSVQESCLLRYFIEELSPWFDHCDEQKHFQLVVPCRAQRCLPLRNAIFAVSSRHLSRLPQYKAPRGIIYHGQLLVDLKTSTAVEYMLRCIPDLVKFHEIQDPEDQENIMAAAVILRQYEEMEEEMEEGDVNIGSRAHRRVNFLAITQAIIDSMISSPLDQCLATAAYWIAIRQEVYYALTRERAPHMHFGPDDWRNASVANTLIMYAGDVTKWCWGDKSPQEWARLKLQQQQLMHDCISQLVPILKREADQSKGEIFPTVWYSFDAQVTGIQHFELARMILIAENPYLDNASSPRAAHRKAESQVRSIVLNLCGIALNHQRCQPALLNAVIAIMLYGEYFTDKRERDALLEIIDRTKNIHAWPMRKPYQTLKMRWELVDCVEL